MKNKIIIVGGLLFVIVLSFILFNKPESTVVEAQSNNEVEKIKNKDSNNNKSTKYKVDIKGAVKKPGVYDVDSNSRVIDVINIAGGLKSNANTNYVNLSAKITDEMVIWIYTTGEISKLKMEQSSSEHMIKTCNCPVVDNTTCLNSNSNKSNTTNNMVNINTASVEELSKLNGIGESKAKNIIDYRNRNGKFNKIEDIMNVTGIGEAAYNKIKENITV